MVTANVGWISLRFLLELAKTALSDGGGNSNGSPQAPTHQSNDRLTAGSFARAARGWFDQSAKVASLALSTSLVVAVPLVHSAQFRDGFRGPKLWVYEGLALAIVWAWVLSLRLEGMYRPRLAAQLP